MCWDLIVEACLGGVIVIKKGEGKNDHKRAEGTVPDGRKHNGNNKSGSK